MKTVHRCKFVNLSSQPITALAITPNTIKSPLLACARQSGSIEIYSIINNELFLNRKIPGIKGNVINKLVWSHQTTPSEESDFQVNAKETEQLISSPPRLFSVGLTGLLIEWDLFALRPKRYSESHGGGIWCMAIHPSHTSIAIGCEDGGIRIFSIKDELLELEKKLPQKPRRVLSLSWFPDGKHLVAGTDVTTVEKWDATLGKITATMKVEYGRKWANTYIWDLLIVGDDLIVCGDSKGNVTLFEGEFGTMVTTFRSHEVDVLCLSANKEGTEFYSAGVDNKLIRYIKSTVGLVSDWTVQSHRRHHCHDTLALALYQSDDAALLFSGGLDMRLSHIDTQKFTFAPFHSLDGFPSPSPIHLASTRRILMASYPDKLKFWKLGSLTDSDTGLVDATQLELDSDYSEQLTILTESNQNILCSAISNDAQWVAFSDVTSIRLFKITWSDDSLTAPVLKKMTKFPPPRFYQLDLPFKFAKEMIFVKRELVVVTTDGRVLAFNLSNLDIVRLVSIPFPNLNAQGFTISQISTDLSRKLISVTHTGNSTVVLDLMTGDLIYSVHGQANDASVLLVGSPAKLAVVNRNWATTLLDLNINDKNTSESLNCTIKNQKIPLACPGPNGKGLVVYDSQHMALLLDSGKTPKVQPHPYNEIMFLGILSQKQLVIVERPYSDLVSELPPAFASKLYTGQRNKKLLV